MDPRLVRLRLVWLTLLGNLLGALLTQFYFGFVDYSATKATPGLSRAELAYFVAGFAAVGVIGYALGSRWTRPITLPGGAAMPVARRRALLLPYALAGLTLLGWVLAGFVWGVLWPLLTGSFAPARSLRNVFAITGIAGTVTTAFVFLATERQWRAILPLLFPEGDASTVPGVPRFPVRARLLLVFLLISVIPLVLVGVMSYTRAAALVDADRATAAVLVQNMLVLIVFILAVGTVAATGLATFVSGSVAGPLRQLQAAMARVERGDLAARCTVIANDELGAVAEGFNQMVHGLRDREAMRETFGKYVSPEIRDEILAGRVALEGQLCEATILFADLRDFTPWVEASDPRAVLRDLNSYFTEMEAAIRGHGGLVLQFIGDEIEAVFGAPIPDPRHAEMAVAAAVEMRRRLGAWNGARQRRRQPALRHGIGIHTGTVIAGNVGSAERLSYALVGDAVNLASRIQGLTKETGIDMLISATTRARLPSALELVALPAAKVKGRSADVELYGLG